MDGKFRLLSMNDSTMMKILHCAMDKAHDKMKTKEGILERLNEISKFYELAVMQLEGCLKFVQEEAASDILESNHEDVIADLFEIRNRLQGRLKDSEMALREKDKELTERFENELKLRQALELKETELVSLRTKVKELRKKCESIEDYMSSSPVSSPVGGDEMRDGEFCDLKNSVDQHILNIRQNLEPECEYDQDNKEINQGGIDNVKIDEMGSDIDILRQTFSVAFGKMHDAIVLSEVAPVEQQWRWTIENDTICVCLKGFMKDVQDMFEDKLWKQKKHVPTDLRHLWPGLMNEVRGLRNELGSLLCQNELQMKSLDSIQTNQESNTSDNKVGHQLSDDYSHNKAAMSLTAEQKWSVAKILESHESTIRRKSEEAELLNWLRREIMREKGYESNRKEKGPVSIKTRLQEVIMKLNNLIDWNVKWGECFDHGLDFSQERVLSETTSLNSDTMSNDEKLEMNNTFADVWEKIHKVPCGGVNEDKEKKMGMLKQQLEETNWKTSVMEETYSTLVDGMLDDLYNQLFTSDLERLLWVDICNHLFIEVVSQYNEKFENKNFEAQIGEEICCIVFGETIKNFRYAYDLKLADSVSLKAMTEKYAAENGISEDIQNLLLRKMFEELNKSKEDYDTEMVIREEIYKVVFDEAVKTVTNTVSPVSLVQHLDVKPIDSLFHDSLITEEFVESTELLIKEDVCMVFIRETIKQWQIDTSDLPSSNLYEHAQDGAEDKVESTLGLGFENSNNLQDQGIVFTSHEEDREPCSFQPEENAAFISHIMKFYDVIMDFEREVESKLRINTLRLEEMEHKLNSIFKLVSTLREKESLYKQAFIKRCQNLRQAETEVDLLGDQVEILIGLLEKVYTTLHRYWPVLQQYVEVSDILQLIKKELNGNVPTTTQR